MLLRSAVFAAIVLGLAACAGVESDPNTYLYAYGKTTNPKPDSFVHCYDFTCRTTVNTFILPPEMARIGALFPTPSRNAIEERKRMAQAIALWEQIVGARTGTSADIGSQSGEKWGGKFQQDCMDETFNTTSYLMMMNDAGWMRFHTVIYPSSRGFQNGFVAPHHAATLRENASGRRFVFDSWFYDNGIPPVVMPVEIWEKGWYPSTHPAWRDE